MEFKAEIVEFKNVKVKVERGSSSRCGTDNRICPVHFDCDDEQLFHDNPVRKTENADDFRAARVKTEPACDSSFFTDDGGNFNDCHGECRECFVHVRSRDPSEVSRQLEQTSTVTSESISSADQARLHAAETIREEPKCTKIPEESGSVVVDNGNEIVGFNNTLIDVSHEETTNIEQNVDTDGVPEERNKTPPVSAYKYECLDCLKRFSSKAHVARHITRTHGGEKLYKCQNTDNSSKDPSNATKQAINPTVLEQGDRQWCNRNLETSKNMKSHKLQHSNTTPRNCYGVDRQKLFKQAANVQDVSLLNSFQNAYGCPHCSKKFTSSSHAKHHLMLHTREKPYLCPMCDKKFRGYSGLKVHMLSHTAKRPYKCPHCGQLFRQSQHLKSHLHWRSGEKPHTCPHCEKEFATFNDLRNHVFKMHLIDASNWPCWYFKRTSTKARSMKTDKRLHKCPQCEKTFASSWNVKRHIVLHNGGKSLQLPCSKVVRKNANLQNSRGPCPHCTKFTSPSPVKRHVMLQTGEKLYFCRICEKKFRSRSGLEVHMLSHTGERPYKCPHCEKLFRQSHHLKSHLHWLSGEKPHTCPHCDNEFATFNDSRNHVIKVHLIDGSNWPCWYCKRTFAEARSMKTEKRLHKCPQCEKTFASSWNVKRHIMSHNGGKSLQHTGEKPYPCPQCGKKFKLSRYVRHHLTVHSGVKPYSCSYCGKAFRTPTHVKIHKRLHTGEKPYKCPKCDQSFRQCQHLKSHMLRLHSDKKAVLMREEIQNVK